MTDVPSGARAPDPVYPVTETYPAETYPAETYPPASYDPYLDAPATGATATGYDAGYDGSDDSGQSKAKQVASQTKDAAAGAAADVKNTATEQAGRVGAEAKTQARNVAADVRAKVGEQARTQHDKLVGTIRQTADHLDEMRGDRADSPAATVVSRVADGGRQLADYLETNGPEGVLREVQDFARRRPGAFLATALAAGFVVGRLGKGVAKADSSAGEDKPYGDSFVSSSPQTGYDSAYDTGYSTSTSTEYAATGTGTPVPVVEPEYTSYDNPSGLR